MFVFFLILSAVISVSVKSASMRQEQELEDIADTIAAYPALGNIIKEITYTPGSDSVQFVVEFSDVYGKAPLLEQYGFLDAYMIKLREYMSASELNNSLKLEDIELISTNLGTEYKFVSANWHKDVKSNSYNETLYVNGEVAYTDSQYTAAKKEYIAGLHEEYINGYSDLEIMKYTVSVFKLITYGGEVITIGEDSRQIVRTITERYGITKKEFSQIYRKYFLLFY
ncbi:hypothetical protein IEO70_14390 [Bacillus sp. AGMB 02131]|uniref:Uncharacterized protein n=1 Tax=Peribacillus faecalis TaxID=2772559 RepID=A0A927CYP2_9BACI|nr:hypothetical protein [Peribacillus faecalis]MBD3109534.1 hypothetical protein [Peribacillus faecalis]